MPCGNRIIDRFVSTIKLALAMTLDDSNLQSARFREFSARGKKEQRRNSLPFFASLFLEEGNGEDARGKYEGGRRDSSKPPTARSRALVNKPGEPDSS